jgi:hypothetical protein
VKELVSKHTTAGDKTELPALQREIQRFMEHGLTIPDTSIVLPRFRVNETEFDKKGVTLPRSA